MVKEIKTNNSQTIQSIRKLDLSDADYDKKKRKFKRGLPYITPNCTVSKRNEDSIIEFSGYMYFDVDDIENAIDRKVQLIEKYKDYISLMCISSSGRGLSFFVKIENEITKSNFAGIREYICTQIFTGVTLDSKVKDETRACFISYDPDCYFNPCAIICIPQNVIDTISNHKYNNNKQGKEEGANRKIIISYSDCLRSAPYQYNLIPISDVITTLKFETEVCVENRIFDMKPIDYCQVFLRPGYRIPKGKKSAVFSQVIHNLAHLNPGINPDYIFSYINYLNFQKTEQGTEATMRDLISHFNMVYGGIINTGVTLPKTRIKYFHCKKNTISPAQRLILSRKMTGMYRVYETINKISLAKEIIESEGANHKIINSYSDCLQTAPRIATQKNVHEIINAIAEAKGVKGIGIRTVKTYWNVEPIDLEEVIKIENDRIEITYIPKSELDVSVMRDKAYNKTIDDGVSDTQILDETIDE